MKKKIKHFAFYRSIRFYIMILLFVMGVVPSIIVESVIVQSYENRAVSQRTVMVKNQCELLVDQLFNRNYLSDTGDDVINGEFNMLTGIYGGRILVINRDSKVVMDTFNLDNGKYSLSQEVTACLNGKETSHYDRDNKYIELTFRIKDPDKKSRDAETLGVLLVSVSTTEISISKGILEERGAMILAIITVVSLILGYVLSGILVKPLQKITRSIEGITDGYQDESISVNDYRETKLITDAFNRMLARVKTVDDSREEFVSNVSHELKTPLTSMKVLADVLNQNPDAPIEEYRDFMKDISAEIDRENSIITDLLALVKMDKKSTDLNITDVNINDELEQIIKRLKPIADKAHVQLILDSFRPITAQVDETKISLAFTNIIENAIKYNKPEGGWVRISLNADRKYCYTTISDNGIGIPEDSLNNIFERFYRVDKSHSREIGGTGLGLAITKKVIVMHRGAIRVKSKLGEGTTFSIRIPLVHIV
ncbi:MAG: HAMP domain-containing sensor histidine kinase [Bilifractor sp.]|nr:cell wall metabolism sensor histidine kinase WalK [Lachnospiraceae bacterium]MDY2837125.1 HAMP domain-containing sensor histidine kinase [Bilifractor sp.]